MKLKQALSWWMGAIAWHDGFTRGLFQDPGMTFPVLSGNASEAEKSTELADQPLQSSATSSQYELTWQTLSCRVAKW